MRRPLRWVSLSLFGVLLPGLAFAWTQSTGFATTVHGHEFHRATLESSECVVKYRFDFTAPEARYAGADKKAPRFRFVGRIRLNSGAAVRSPIFPNAAPGERQFKGTFDTASEGCWAKQEQKIIALDVRGCRGQGCVPDEFD
jgi:hypothetical protein